MKIFIDTNVLISAILYPSGVPSQAFFKAAAGKNTLLVSRQNIDELYRVFRDKFPDDLPRLDAFVETAMRAVQIVEIPQKPAPEEFQIRDADDRPNFTGTGGLLYRRAHPDDKGRFWAA